ncbi:hypothetical protein CR513_51277, partial [Mucuna pruriens]
MIINEGRCVNVASEKLVKKQTLPIIIHPRPYRLQWLSEKGQLLVDKQVEVTFILGNYEDKVVYDVVLMEATNLLLGRLWQFDKKGIHDGVTNRFTFIHMGQRVMLKSLSLTKVHKDQKKMKVKRESDREIERKIRKKKSKNDSKKRKEKGKEKVGEKKKKKVRKKKNKSKRKEEKRKQSLLVGCREVRRILLAKKEPLFAFRTNILLHASPCDILPIGMGKLLKEFQDVFPKDIPYGLPLLRGIKHYIDLKIEASLLNRHTYRMILKEAKEIEK